jgi:hypothetical protein
VPQAGSFVTLRLVAGGSLLRCGRVRHGFLLIPCMCHACPVGQPRRGLRSVFAMCSCCHVLRVFLFLACPASCLSCSVFFVPCSLSQHPSCSLSVNLPMRCVFLFHSVGRVLSIFNYLSLLGASTVVFLSLAVHSHGLLLR